MECPKQSMNGLFVNKGGRCSCGRYEIGARVAKRLSTGKETLRLVFSGVVAAVGVYVVFRGIQTLTGMAGA
jgi:hypothetical protein